MTDPRAILRSLSPKDIKCPLCGWSLQNSGMTRDAHDAICDGLKPQARQPKPQEG